MHFRALFSLVAALVGCDASSRSPTPAPTPPAAAPVELVRAAAGDEDVRAIVVRERARRPSRDVLVYVGAPWCEPCVRFHDAAAAGKLDAAFPGLVLVELDADRDAERLKRDGYASRLVPLFALPGADGASTGRQIEGSIKGEGAVAEITPRLAALLGRH